MIERARSFGAWLKQRRLALDLTRRDLAACAGCSVETIRKLEVDRRRPSKQIAELLADCLHVPADERAAFIGFARTGDGPLPATAGEAGRPAARPLLARLLTPLTPLIGRQQAVAEVSTLLLGSGVAAPVRLLTLVGPPGIGKTRLALQVGADLESHFPDGASFIQLAAVTDPDLVLPILAQRLGVREDDSAGSRTIAERLAQSIADKRMLIVLDNFEQVVKAAAPIAELLVTCPGLQMLVTSRERLHVRGERQYLVPALGLPDLALYGSSAAGAAPEQRLSQARRAPGVRDLLAYPAVALFVERARAAAPGFALTEANAAAVAAICARLDGLPLAIELIAARTRLLPAQELQARLSGSWLLVTPGPRDLPARHQTLFAAINSSYGLLTAGEQRLFSRLAVFAGGCTLAAAEAVCRGDDASAPGGQPAWPVDVLEGIMSLLDKSLLLRDPDSPAEARVVMLETVREYAQARLAAEGEDSPLRRRHAEYFAALAEEADRELRGSQQQQWLARLEREQGNIRTALGWALDHDAPDLAARLGGTLWRFWEMHGHLSEGRRWLARVLAQPALPAARRAKVLNAAALLARDQGDLAQARALYEESIALYRRLDDAPGLASVVNNLAVLLFDQGDLDEAGVLFAESLALHRAVGDQRGVAIALSNLSGLAVRRHDYARAEALGAESLDLFRALGDNRAQAAVLANLAALAYERNDYARAQALLLEMLALAAPLGDLAAVAMGLEGVARTALMQPEAARAPTAVRLLAAAEALQETLGSQRPPEEQAEYAEAVAEARSLIGEAAFGRAWAAGRALSPEDAIHLAQTVGATAVAPLD